MGKSGKQPKVWLCNSPTTGDFNNGFAVAKALNPDHRIVDFYDLEKKDDGTFKVIFQKDRHSHDNYVEYVKPEDLPDVLIDTSDHHQLFNLVHFENSEAFKNIREDTLFAKTLLVGMGPPDMNIIVDTGLPRKNLADINIVFSHQIPNDADLPSNMHPFDVMPSRINKKLLMQNREAAEKLVSEFKLERPVHALIIGYEGGHIIGEHTKDIESIAEKVVSSIKETGGSLIVTTSPRTQNPKAVLNIFNKAVEGTNIKICLDEFNQDPQKNNYLKILSAADKIIFTSDSISTSSDIVATGKPCYLFKWDNTQQHPGDIATPMTDKYNNILIERELIMPIAKLSEPASPTKHVNSAEAIAQLIRNELDRQKKPRTTIAGDLVRPASKSFAKKLDELGKFLGVPQR